MDFTSERFAGDGTLEEILNDPDTGTKKLAKGSPVDAVKAVQRALLDLDWVRRWVGPAGVLAPSQFVDGDYGPWTDETVLHYKQHYDIHFPPDEPTGTYDGFAGPRTLRSLDGHCTLLDEADAAITARAAELGVALGAPDGVGRRVKTVRRSAGATRHLEEEIASFVYKRGLGTFLLRGPVYVEWVTNELEEGTGAATDTLGFPIADETTEDGTSSGFFERGTIEHDIETAASVVNVDPNTVIIHQEIEF